MKTHTNIPGIHHITAIASSPSVNVRFYENVLGLNLVKQTVNFDDPYTYHLYYGDKTGTPGTILTFFPWEGINKGYAGTGMVSAIGFSIPEGSVDYWLERLKRHDIDAVQENRFSDTVLSFADPDGLRLELVTSAQETVSSSASQTTAEREYRIRGFHSATSQVSSFEQSAVFLQETLGMELTGTETNRYRFTMNDDTAVPKQLGIFYDLVVSPEIGPGRQGSGTVHHIAFRAPMEEDQAYWQQALYERGLGVTPIRDRQYFRSIYFHEPGGVLFEIATDTPGFAVDESPDKLGHSLMLPPQYERLRQNIEERLPLLHRQEFTHRFIPAEDGIEKTFTIVALHGTGGDENDLIPLAQQIGGGTAILSPRGRVSEQGMNRFFKRLSPGVLDEQDIINRSGELADFIKTAASRYERHLDKFIALGYSNGANIASANLLLQPELYTSAILFRPMLPLLPSYKPNLSDKYILILRGLRDTIIPAESTEKLIGLFRENGAHVEVVDISAGHELTADDIASAKNWFARLTNVESAY